MVRLVSGLVLGVAALAAIYFLPAPILRILVVGISLLAAHEYAGIARPGRQPASNLLAYLFVAATCWLLSDPASPQAEIVLLLAFVLLLVEVLFSGRTLAEAASAIAGGIYIGLPLAALVSIHRWGGRESVLLLIGTIVVSDSAQYYSGRAFGRHPLAPAISPKKTVEGALGGVVLGSAFMAILGMRVYPAVPPFPLAVAGLVIVILGICGDLFESRLKRAAGVKDSSSLIPGHGGVLDRIDALLCAAPAFYLFLQRWM